MICSAQQLNVTAKSDKRYLVYRVETSESCYVDATPWRWIDSWHKSHVDHRRTKRSRFAGSFVQRDIGFGRVAFMPYEVERPLIATRLGGLLTSRMHCSCKRFDSSSLPVTPSEMAKDFLGCSLSSLVEKFECRMTDGMDWSNFGARGWVIDHILPVSMFDFRLISHVKKACHHSNLRPCWESENIRKSDRITLEN